MIPKIMRRKLPIQKRVLVKSIRRKKLRRNHQKQKYKPLKRPNQKEALLKIPQKLKTILSKAKKEKKQRKKLSKTSKMLLIEKMRYQKKSTMVLLMKRKKSHHRKITKKLFLSKMK